MVVTSEFNQQKEELWLPSNDDAVEKVSLGSWLIIEHKMFDSGIMVGKPTAFKKVYTTIAKNFRSKGIMRSLLFFRINVTC